MDPKEALEFIAPRSRDNARTPYQWDGSENAGFTTGKPWLGINPNYTEINLEKDKASEDSVFYYYKELISLRKTRPALIEGKLQFYLEDHPQIVCYSRICDNDRILVIANFSGEEASFSLPQELVNEDLTPILSNVNSFFNPKTGKTLAPWETCVYEY